MGQFADGSGFTHTVNANHHNYIRLMIAVFKIAEIVAVVFGQQFAGSRLSAVFSSMYLRIYRGQRVPVCVQ
jgi:hypothetical protein